MLRFASRVRRFATKSAVRKEDNFVSHWLAPVYTKEGWRVKLQPLTAANVEALKYLDNHYGPHYGQALWGRTRAALLTPPQKVALWNRFCGEEQPSQDFMQEQDHIDLASSLLQTWSAKKAKILNNCNFPSPSAKLVNAVPDAGDRDEFIQPSQYINAQTFEKESRKDLTSRVISEQDLEEREDGVPRFLQSLQSLTVLARKRSTTESPSLQLFEPPKAIPTTGKFNYYPLDFASILPVVALGLQPQDSVLDLCAAPGGKTLVMLQTLLPGQITCCDVSESRLERLSHSLQANGPSAGVQKVRIMRVERLSPEEEQFDKILVDAPCLTDRHWVTAQEEKTAAASSYQHRVNLPSKQLALLNQAMRLCKPGGTVVYSTCTLSPAQNQEVVRAALNQQAGLQFDLVSLSLLCRTLQENEHLDGLRARLVDSAGLQIFPTISVNFGPAFVAKLQKRKNK